MLDHFDEDDLKIIDKEIDTRCEKTQLSKEYKNDILMDVQEFEGLTSKSDNGSDDNSLHCKVKEEMNLILLYMLLMAI